MSRNTKEHYEDVARLLRRKGIDGIGEREPTRHRIIYAFADLFAADNPACAFLDCTMHQGFDREQFLAACGLEPKTTTCPLCSCPSEDGDVHPSCADTEQAYTDYVAGKIAGEFE